MRNYAQLQVITRNQTTSSQLNKYNSSPTLNYLWPIHPLLGSITMTTPMPTPDFGLFTSLRYDPQLLQSSENTRLSGNSAPSPFYNFVYHYERFINALDHFGWRLKNETATTSGERSSSANSEGSHPNAIAPVADIEKFRDATSAAVERYFASQIQGDGQRDTLALKVRSICPSIT
jgi:hypothetical protein